MRKIYPTNIKIVSIGLAIMLSSVLFKLIFYKMVNTPTPYLNIFYLSFLILWLISINHRIVQDTSRRILVSIAGSELFWLIIRIIKFELFTDDQVQARYCWYLYYLPFLMIPALCLIFAFSLRKPEGYKPPKALWISPLISLLLFLLVLTNDLHHAVFIIPQGKDGTEVGNYHYGWGYFAIVGYIALCVILFYGMILVKCRVRSRRILHFLPLIPLFFGACVCVIYCLGTGVLFGFYHIDITVLICFLTTTALEMCIQSGLIMSNVGYKELFRNGSLKTIITDEEFTPLFTSNDYINEPLPNGENLKNGPVLYENGLRLNCASIRGGYVLWQDDLSELQKTLLKLSEKKDYLEEKNSIILQANNYQKKERQLIEKNRLYNQILTQTKKEIEQYAKLVEEMDAETDPKKSQSLAIKLAFIGAYIKRHDNLTFLNEMDNSIAPSELSYCIEESLSILRLAGINCFCSYGLTNSIPFEKISRMYKGFFDILFAQIDLLSSVCTYLIEDGVEGDAPAIMVIRITCTGETNFTPYQNDFIQAEKEENEWVITIK